MSFTFVKKGPELVGRRVVATCSQQDLAELFELTPRQILKLERLGLPCLRRSGRELSYPWPHAFVWRCVFLRLIADGEVVKWLDPAAAFEVFAGHRAEDDARSDGKLRTRRSRRAY